jgi:hypothetical protein
MKPDRWPLPIIEEILDNLSGFGWITKLDLFRVYWQMHLSEACKAKTASVCKYGTFHFEVMPFGLRNAPAAFQHMMDMFFVGVPFVRKNLDDLVIMSRSLTDHVQQMTTVIEILSRHGLKIKLSKGDFARQEIKLLGKVVDTNGVTVDLDKVTTVLDYPIPTDKREARGVLGLFSYYRRFIPKFSLIAGPIYALTSPKTVFEWTGVHQCAFEKLKALLCSAPILAYPDFSRPFMV